MDFTRRFIRVFDIALGHQLRSALLKWKYTVRAIVRQERDLQYFKEKSFTKVVKEFWRKWRQEWKKSKNYRLALHRYIVYLFDL